MLYRAIEVINHHILQLYIALSGFVPCKLSSAVSLRLLAVTCHGVTALLVSISLCPVCWADLGNSV